MTFVPIPTQRITPPRINRVPVPLPRDLQIETPKLDLGGERFDLTNGQSSGPRKLGPDNLGEPFKGGNYHPEQEEARTIRA